MHCTAHHLLSFKTTQIYSAMNRAYVSPFRVESEQHHAGAFWADRTSATHLVDIFHTAAQLPLLHRSLGCTGDNTRNANATATLLQKSIHT